VFSKELIQYTIRYFKEKYAHDISEEKAELYLTQCAELFGAFMSLLGEKHHIPHEPDMIQ